MSITKSILSTLSAILIFLNLPAQPTVGVVYTTEQSLPGYTFFSPFSGTKAYIIDNCGRVVNEWDRGTRPGLSAYFLETGLMLRTYKPDPAGPFTSASNSGGLELVDWNNNTVWHYEHNTPTQISHHDAVYMPNGNLLVLTWELVYTAELIEMGRDPDEIAPEGYMWSERIMEWEIVGSNDINIVWEWSIKDHYVQDFDPTKLNYGVVADHPELFNINLPELSSSNSNSSRDWNHMNAIDYNAELDQILLSVRNSDEIWILDHSTTTAEAATHSGGLYGKGGDILYRWGNGSAYNRAPVSDQQLFGQHGVQWIRDGLEDAGKIIIYNNGNGRPGPDYSTVELLTPPQDADGGYILPDTDPFGPDASEIIYGDLSGETFYSAYLSNAQRLSNGNTLVNAGSPGYIFEIDADRNVVWEYIIPLNGDFPVGDGQVANSNGNFRAYKFPADYSGFWGVDLTPGDLIETISNPLDCNLVAVGLPPALQHPTPHATYHSPSHSIYIQNPELQTLNVTIYHLSGRKIVSQQLSAGSAYVSLEKGGKGVYMVEIVEDNGERVVERVVVY